MNHYSTRLHICVLSCLTIFIYLNTLDSYFVADDLWQVHYCFATLSGDIDLLWRNFSGNFIELPGAEFYRPLLGVTYLLDYCLSGTNPLAYHLSNLILYLANIVLVYLMARELSRTWSEKRSSISALFAGALFAATPLHCEAVAWVSGRADILAGVFYLLSLYLFVLHMRLANRFLYPASLVSFILALGSKEVAICLPVVIFSLLLLYDGGDRKKTLLKALPYPIIAGLYLCLRFACFGTALGGYTGGFGSAKCQYVIQQWFDLRIWLLIPFPFNLAAIDGAQAPFIYVGGSLIICTAFIIVRLLMRSLHKRWILFLLLWQLSALLPVMGIWGIDPILHNSRLVFFLTMPHSILLPGLLFQPDTEDRGPMLNLALKTGSMASALALSIITLFYFWASFKTNNLWRESGITVKTVLSECKNLAAATAPEKQIIVLGIPEDNDGAFIILNGSTLNHLLSPPFCKPDLSQRFISFKPFIFGPESQINSSRFKKLLTQKKPAVYIFDRQSMRFSPIELIAKESPTQPLGIEYEVIGNCSKQIDENGILKLSEVRRGSGLLMKDLGLSPLDYDFLEFSIKATQKKSFFNQLTPLIARWNSLDSNSAIGAIPSNLKNMRSVRIGLSQYWRWYQEAELDNIRILFGAARSIEIKDIQLVSASNLVPTLEIENLMARMTGEYIIKDKSFSISYDSNKI
ncbi:MAG: hypothetical protein K8F91_01270 [Candidatus Obscuribacterales bacterium]|nr:hypothetical protein [Candidatus Obscuribacterales bacterium]